MKILITGGKGFVGSNFDYGIKISREDCDLMNFDQTLKVFEEIKPDAIIHTAGKIGGVLGNRNEKGAYCYENVVINTNVLEAARRAGVKRVLSLSSSCAYPEHADIPYKEEDFHNGMPHLDHYGYAYSKRLLDVMSRTYCEQYGLKYNCVVFGNIYGPNDHFGKITGHLVPSLVYKAYLASKNSSSFEVWGDGSPKRQFIFVKDVVEVCKRLLEDWEDPGIINVVNPKEYSITQVANMISSYLDVPYYFNKNMPKGQYRKPISVTKFMLRFPQFVFTELEDGIKETIDWVIENNKGE